MPRTKNKTPLEQARSILGFSARSVANTIGLDPSGFIRIEQGKFTPRQDTARAIYLFYGEFLPLGMIYDPTHPKYKDAITSTVKRRLRKWANYLDKNKDTLRRVAG